MNIIWSVVFIVDCVWGVFDIVNLNGIMVWLYWIDQLYCWYVNDGEEVFVVFDGCVEMCYCEVGVEYVMVLEMGDVFYVMVGIEYVVYLFGVVCILVIEIEGSV